MATKHRADEGDEVVIKVTYVSVGEIEAKELVEKYIYWVRESDEIEETSKLDHAKRCALIDIEGKILLLVSLGESGKFNVVAKHLLDEIEYLNKVRNKIINLK